MTAQITNPPKPEHTIAQWKARLAVDGWVTVASCHDKQMWYREHVGEAYLIHAVDEQGLWTRAPDGYTNFIAFRDAEF